MLCIYVCAVPFRGPPTMVIAKFVFFFFCTATHFHPSRALLPLQMYALESFSTLFTQHPWCQYVAWRQYVCQTCKTSIGAAALTKLQSISWFLQFSQKSFFWSKIPSRIPYCILPLCLLQLPPFSSFSRQYLKLFLSFMTLTFWTLVLIWYTVEFPQFGFV